MAKSINTIVIATDTFSSLITRTNQVISALSTEIITANTSVNGANTTGNTNLIGIFGANTVAVGNSLRGGTVNAAANLQITSNAVFAGTKTTFQSNVQIDSGATIINAVATYVTGTTLTIGANTTATANVTLSGSTTAVTGNAVFSGALTTLGSTTTSVTSNTFNVVSNTFNIQANTVDFQSNAAFSGALSIGNIVTLNNDINYGPDGILGKQTSVINTDLGATVGTPIVVYEWPRADYSGANITTVTKNGSRVRMSVVLAVTNGSDVIMSEHGTIHAPVGANLGIYSVGTNGANAVLKFTQTAPNSLINLNITLTA